MEGQSLESLVEERVAQLEAISQRRNALLRQMFHMVQKRQSVGSIIKLPVEDAEDDDELAAFLDKFDLAKKCVINLHLLHSHSSLSQSRDWKHR
ncbi:hypothetical protein C8R47DRAFT_484076 [Mycena vitilis]|nr:hypothetical protein C8R47DRAFT_484076 [Mycena vitilis]